MEPSAFADLEATVGKSSRRIFQASVIAFILGTSFIYGFIKGSTKQAYAYKQAGLTEFAPGSSDAPDLDLPAGIVPFTVGEDARINNKSVNVVSFFTERSVEEIAFEQAATWRKANYKVLEKSSARRGVVVAMDEATGRRYSLAVWQVPPTLRKAVASGYPVQGMISAAERNEQTISADEAERGAVPGVPIPPGGSGGSVFSALEPSGRSYSAMYTANMPLESAKAFYLQQLGGANAESWKFAGQFSSSDAGAADLAPDRMDQPLSRLGLPAVEQLQFVRPGEELTLLFTEIPEGAQLNREGTIRDRATLVTVVRAPKPASKQGA